MDKISDWCKIIALFSIASSIILMILPEGANRKSYRLLISFIMIYTFISPVADIDADFSALSNYFEIGGISDNGDSISNYEHYPVIAAAEAETEEYLNSVLASIGCDGYCKAALDFKADRIYIREITIYGVLDEKQKNIIRAEIYKIYGEAATIIFLESSNEY